MAYLTTAEYVARFGEDETRRLTSENRADPAIDLAKLQAEIDEAEAYVNNRLRARYPIPLPSTPTEVRGIVGDLTRERLHRTRPLTPVTEAADRARADLRDLSTGRAVLLLEGGEVPERTPASMAAWGRASDAQVFNREKLDRY